jgi:hypothetical protein
MCQPWRGVNLQILAVFAAPALVAAYLAATVDDPAGWEQAAMLALPWVTAVLGTVVVMMAVSHQAHNRPIGLAGASREALPWVPRYFWTNVHTSVIFWVPVGLLIQARAWQEANLPLEGASAVVLGACWWLATAVAALCLHTRTLLAPFLAVHGDLPGTLAALESWRLSGRHFAVCFSTFVVATLPVGLPLAMIALTLLFALSGPSLAAFMAASPDLVWAGIQAVRLVLIPALYLLYGDLWGAELDRRRIQGEPPVPAPARALLAITRPLPGPGWWR